MLLIALLLAQLNIGLQVLYAKVSGECLSLFRR